MRVSKAEFERLYAALGRLEKGGAPEDPDALLDATLRSKDPHLAARAARVVKDRRLAGYEERMVAAYDHLFAKKDPGCLAKVGLAEALDFVDYGDEGPFRRGVSHVQRAPGDGDAAAALRVRCGLALVRLRVDDALTVLCDLLADPEPFVRSGAARGLSYHGDASGGALLRLKLHAGDPDPGVTADVLGAYVALGDSRVPAALPLLTDYVAAAARERDVRVGLVAILSLRSDSGEGYLRELLEGPDELRARVAREVLGG